MSANQFYSSIYNRSFKQEDLQRALEVYLDGCEKAGLDAKAFTLDDLHQNENAISHVVHNANAMAILSETAQAGFKVIFNLSFLAYTNRQWWAAIQAKARVIPEVANFANKVGSLCFFDTQDDIRACVENFVSLVDQRIITSPPEADATFNPVCRDARSYLVTVH